MSKDTLIDIRDFIHDDTVASFITNHVNVLMPWERFCKEPMPLNLPPETMWEVVEFVRLTGSSFQMPLSRTVDGTQENSPWYCFSSEMSALLTRLLYRGRTAGTLSQRLLQYSATRTDHPFLIADLSAAATRDGLQADLETILLLVLKKKDVTTLEEHLIANAIDVLESLTEYQQKAFDNSLFNELQQRLDEGCEALPYKPARRPPTSYDAYGGRTGNSADPCFKYSQEQKDSCLDFISTHIDPCQKSKPSPILATILASDLICEKRPFPRWNGFMELFLRKLAFDRIGLHALADVPFSRALLDWELGLPSTSELPFSFGNAILHSRYGNNITPYLMQLLQFLDQGLDMLERETDSLVRRLASCRSALENNCRLNYRQQKLLMHFLEKPDDSIDSATYEHEHDVTLATARSDLKKLVRLGYLHLGEMGKKQVFTPVPHLEKVILANR